MRLLSMLLGARRGVMSSKRGNKDFYKGRGCRPAGVHTNKGRYIVLKGRVPEIVVPNMDGEISLKPYVSYRTPYISGKPVTMEDILELHSQQ